MILAFHKPYGVLSQFTRGTVRYCTLEEFGFPPEVYAIGRLDGESEGLLLLSNEKKWNDLLLHPRHAHERTYHAQVEGVPTDGALVRLATGVIIQGYLTQPCLARRLPDPGYPARVVPVRSRRNLPMSWIEVKLTEGKNRQVRRMTAAVGYPTLRLIRVAIGGFTMGDLAIGAWRALSPEEIEHLKNPKNC